MYIFPQVEVILSLTWLIGMAISVLYTVPMLLLSKYHRSSVYKRKVLLDCIIDQFLNSLLVFTWYKTKLRIGLCHFGFSKLSWSAGNVNNRKEKFVHEEGFLISMISTDINPSELKSFAVKHFN